MQTVREPAKIKKRNPNSLASRALEALSQMPQPATARDVQRALADLSGTKASASAVRADLMKRGYIARIVVITPAGIEAMGRV